MIPDTPRAPSANSANARPSSPERDDGRAPDALRPVHWTMDIAPNAAASVLIRVGNTEVICAVSLENAVPRWMRAQNIPGGWLTAEYSLLPYSTSPRTSRDASTGRIGGRTHEIQRMIGRALRTVVNLEALGPRTLWIDCDVIRADGGTRTAAVTGAGLALELALERLVAAGTLETNPLLDRIAAVSAGLVGGRLLLDLHYAEDAAAEVDLNVVMTGQGRFIEVQGTGEREAFSREELDGLLDLAASGIRQILETASLAAQGARGI